MRWRPKKKQPIDLRPTDPYLVFRPGAHMINVSIRTEGDRIVVELLEDSDVYGVDAKDTLWKLSGPRAMLTYSKTELRRPVGEGEVMFEFPGQGPTELGSTHIHGTPAWIALTGGPVLRDSD